MSRSCATLALCLGIALLSVAPAQAAFKLAPCFSSNMVLQRGMPVPVWGTAAAGDAVTVSFAGQAKTAKSDEKGRWSVKLAPLALSAEPAVMTVTTISADGKTEKLELANVLVGDVWLGSGQSNMAMGGGSYTGSDPVLAANIATTNSLLRLLNIRSGWQVSSPPANLGMSALLFSFGYPLQKELGVPVGLMVGAVGGSPSGYWLSREAFDADAAIKAEIEAFAASPIAEREAQTYVARMATWSQEVAKAKAVGGKVPSAPFAPLKAGESRAPIGNLHEAHIRPLMPFAIKGVLWDQGESRTGVGGVRQETLMKALIAGWRREWGQGDFPFLYIRKPSGGGMAWDYSDPVTRRSNPPASLPATPSVMGADAEDFLKLRMIPGAYMVDSADLGSGVHPACKSGYGARAARVALGAVYGKPVVWSGPVPKAAESKDGKMVIIFNHVGKGLAAGTNAPAGSKALTGLQGFSIAGPDRVFYWADAVIEGDTVVVSSPKVTQPLAVRYAWADVHAWANLFNQDGLPAAPFKTDEW